MKNFHRRDFIKTSLFGGIAASMIPTFAIEAMAKETKVSVSSNSQVSLVTGSDRADMAFRALKPFSKEIARIAGKRRIIVKPNMVASNIQLSATHKDTIEGILEFYKSINKLENVVVAESAADGPTMTAFDNYGYPSVVNKYKVKLMNLDETPYQIFYVLDEADMRPKMVRMSKILTDRNNFVMSSARMKTHDCVVTTLSLKNIALAAPIKETGFSWGPNSRAGSKSDKSKIHGNGIRAINYNIFNLAFDIRPDLAFIDGFDGMEGNGPTQGTPVDHRVCVAGFDWMSVDRVGIELMGIDPSTVGYLNFCADAGMGQFDLNKIDVIGEKIANHKRTYKLAKNIESQLQWMTPLKARG